MPIVKLGPDARPQYFDTNGNPAIGYKLFTYAAGSTTKLATYTDNTGTTPNANPMVLDAAGRTPFGKWYQAGLAYKEVLAPPYDTDPPTSPTFTADGLTGINDNTISASGASSAQWVASGLTPTYINATQFTLAGDQRGAFHVGRRLQLTVTAGTLYGLISASAYTTLTTVTVILDSGVLDAGLSAVDLGILTSVGSSLPVTAFVRGLLDDADAATFRNSIGINFMGSLLSVGASAPALTHTGGRDSFTGRFGDATPNSIYDAIFPGIAHFDALNGVAQVTAGSTIEHATGVAGYVINNDASPTNAVSLFGAGIAAVDDSHVWGINTLLQDAPTRVAGTGLGRRLTCELDFNVMNPATQVIGLSIGGNSLAQPTIADGFICNVLGVGFKWVTAFNSQDAAATFALSAGMLALSGPSVNSQKVVWQYTTPGSVKQNIHAHIEAGGYLTFGGSIAPLGYSFQGASIFLDAGMTLRIGGNSVVGGRVTGYAAMTGTADKATVYDTASVTLAQLAGRVMQLQADLTIHGMIGA